MAPVRHTRPDLCERGAAVASGSFRTIASTCQDVANGRRFGRSNARQSGRAGPRRHARGRGGPAVGSGAVWRGTRAHVHRDAAGLSCRAEVSLSQGGCLADDLSPPAERPGRYHRVGLLPYLSRLEPDRKEEYLASYHALLARPCPVMEDGTTLLAFPRIFIVATR